MLDSNRNSSAVVAMVLAWISFVGVLPGRAQGVASAHETEPSWRLLSASEGRSIVTAAWELDKPARGTQDCSHAVHQIYTNAGFEYAYASSFEIYSGNENFARVRNPQSGDVIAWPGHVGIVSDPLQHNFYSLVSTGWQAQDYLAPYWRSRGRPRFYRYKIEVAAGVTSAAKAPAPPVPSISNATKQPATTQVAEERTPTENVDPNRPPKVASERIKAKDGSPNAGASAATAPLSADIEEATPFEMPTSILVAPKTKRPTVEEVAEGISELNDAAGSLLRSEDPSKTQLPMVIVEQFKVEQVQVKRDHGWARLQVDSKVFLGSGAAHLKRQRVKVRWELRRTESGWEAVAPTDRNYVPHDVAVKNLAAQLARLTETDGAAAHDEKVLQQESRVANLLSMLLTNK